MYSNITIFDDDAFISFYDSIGSGESNFALHLNRNSNNQGYRKIEEEFLRMWDADSDFGTKSKKKRGTSIIFLNDKDQILLFLRDDKKTIPFPNTWDVLGGHVEDRETPVETIVREIDEEMEIILDNPKLFNVYDLVDRIEHTFWQRANFDIAQIVLHEGQRLRWFTEGEIERMTDEELAFGFRHILMDFFNKKPFI